MTLKFQEYIDLPWHEKGGFDHADVHEASGRVFVAHTALGQVEILDGLQHKYVGTVPECLEASGVLGANEINLMFAAARGNGQILVLAAPSGEVVRTFKAGSAPNGLAWDSSRQQLLVADVKNWQARLSNPLTGEVLATVELPGRPRWSVYDQRRDSFWVNICDPALVVGLSGKTTALVTRLPVAYAGPHGLAVDEVSGQLLVACQKLYVFLPQSCRAAVYSEAEETGN